MADEVGHIAHLFLSELEGQGSPLTVRALIGGHLEDSEGAIQSVARHLARQLGSAAVLNVSGDSVSLELFSTGDGGQNGEPGGSDLPGEKDLERSLSKLPEQTHLLLVGLDVENSLLDVCEEISVMVGPDSSSVVASYSQLKKLAGGYSEILGITVTKCGSTDEGKALAERIRQTAKECLVLPLRIHAIVPKNYGVRQSKLAEGSVPEKGALRQIIESLRHR